MAYEFLLIMLSVLIVSLISFVGVFALSLKQSIFNNLLFILVAFAAGTLLAAALIDMLPEALEAGDNAGQGQQSIFIFVLLGILVFYSIERFIFWHHHHHREGGSGSGKEIHTFVYLNLIGDGIHNFLDGGIIAASFLTNIPLGIATTVAIMMHEIPQEFGDFALLIHGGLTKMKALFYNFLSAIAAIVGALASYFFLSAVTVATPFLLSFGVGGLLYIACTDLIPELHKETGVRKSILQFASMVAGILLIFAIISFFE